MTETLKNFDAIYYEGQRVFIHSGFYRENYANIKGFDEKTKMFLVEFVKENAKKQILCAEKDLRPVKKMFGK